MSVGPRRSVGLTPPETEFLYPQSRYSGNTASLQHPADVYISMEGPLLVMGGGIYWSDSITWDISSRQRNQLVFHVRDTEKTLLGNYNPGFMGQKVPVI